MNNKKQTCDQEEIIDQIKALIEEAKFSAIEAKKSFYIKLNQKILSIAKIELLFINLDDKKKYIFLNEFNHNEINFLKIVKNFLTYENTSTHDRFVNVKNQGDIRFHISDISWLNEKE